MIDSRPHKLVLSIQKAFYLVFLLLAVYDATFPLQIIISVLLSIAAFFKQIWRCAGIFIKPQFQQSHHVCQVSTFFEHFVNGVLHIISSNPFKGWSFILIQMDLSDNPNCHQDLTNIVQSSDLKFLSFKKITLVLNLLGSIFFES